MSYYYLREAHNGVEDVIVKVAHLHDYVPAELVHDVTTALLAARTYAETGKRDHRFEWQSGKAKEM